MHFNIVRKEIARTSTITMALLSMLQKRKCNLRNHNTNTRMYSNVAKAEKEEEETTRDLLFANRAHKINV